MDTLKCSDPLCKKLPKWHVVYDAGITTQDLTLCSFHYESNPAFKKNIKSITEVSD